MVNISMFHVHVKSLHFSDVNSVHLNPHISSQTLCPAYPEVRSSVVYKYEDSEDEAYCTGLKSFLKHPKKKS
jgi:hypothetical protein